MESQKFEIMSYLYHWYYDGRRNGADGDELFVTSPRSKKGILFYRDFCTLTGYDHGTKKIYKKDFVRKISDHFPFYKIKRLSDIKETMETSGGIEPYSTSRYRLRFHHIITDQSFSQLLNNKRFLDLLITDEYAESVTYSEENLEDEVKRLLEFYRNFAEK